MQLINFNENHYQAIKKIYQEGVNTKNATAETRAPSWDDFDKKFRKDIRIALTQNAEILGWATVAQVSKREVYKGVVEVTIYVNLQHHRKGYGECLLKELINLCEQKGIWTMQATILIENLASINLHKKLGFRELGKREKIVKIDSVWRDTVLLERRSKINK